jgi:LysR family transcriptional regulator, low CO2-responsive transcriptional regulator
MTPAQLRAFAAVARLGSVSKAAAEFGVSEAAVSGHIGQLRRGLDDQLFHRTGSGLAFTPGGLRLAARATELLGLQDQAVREVREAGNAPRLLRLATSSLFAEYAAPGLIELFASRAKDIEVELSVRPTRQLAQSLLSRVADVAIGPRPEVAPEQLETTTFLKYQLILVVGRGHPLAGSKSAAQLREQTWLLGPSAAIGDGVAARVLRQFDVAESKQRIFQSHAAALDESKRDRGVALALSFAVAEDLAEGRLVQLIGRGTTVEGMWAAMTLPPNNAPQAAGELTRFITTPRATQAMLSGTGANIGRFRPSVHVTLWS